MAALVTVSDGNVIIDDDVNQFNDAFNAVFGITDTTQDAPGRFVFPKSTSAPGTPSTAMAYMETDEGVESSGGRLKVRHAKNGSGAPVWVPYLPLRQIVKASSGATVLTSSTTYVDITNATLSITTTGGKLKIYVITDDTSTASMTVGGGATSSLFQLRAQVGATNLAGVLLGATTASLNLQASFPIWYYQPVAGTYTVKLQGLVGAATTSLLVSGGFLVVEELGD